MVFKINSKKIKLSLFLFWILFIFFSISTYIKLDIPLLNYPNLIKNFISNFGVFSSSIFVIISILRPLIFFPATLLTISAALLFGPILGFILVFIGESLSSTLSYFLGKYFGSKYFENILNKKSKINKMDCKFKENTFITILTMRLIYFPFDFLGYFSGICKVKYFEYILATMLGIIPGILTFILLSASVFNPINLIFAIIILIIGLIIRKYLLKTKIIIKKL